MKTMKFKLLAIAVTLAAVITTSTTNAQRRSSDNRNNRTEDTRTVNKNKVEKKSASRDNAREQKAANHKVKSSADIKRNNVQSTKEKQKSAYSSVDNSRGSKNNQSKSSSSLNNNRKSNSNQSERMTYSRNNSEPARKKSNQDKSIVSSAEMSRRTTGYSNGARKPNEKEAYNPVRNHDSDYSGRNSMNTNDTRYSPSREYRGSNKYWSDNRDNAPRGSHSNGKSSYNHYKHWDKHWENYRWNHNSWVNYYGYYDPFPYKHYKYYYHHPYYGNVVRKFVYRPQIYVHNHIKYYCYDGYFFRYRRGIGYILVDMPFGMTFDYLPGDYETVFINGYLYFRIGNVFFERTNYGFQLVYYPERFYAYNDGYRSEGFRFNDLSY